MMIATGTKVLGLGLAASVFIGVGAAAAPGTQSRAASGAQSTYQQERAACLSGNTGQDRATCLKEAGAARAEAGRNNLSDGQGHLGSNAKDRCNALTGGERSDCLARMNGQGTVSGSVQGGGILREKVTIVPAPSGGQAASGTKPK